MIHMSEEADLIIEKMVSTRKSTRGKVFGFGVFDAEFPKGAIIDGKWVLHRAYNIWSLMIRRCYESKTEVSKRAYSECVVDNEWMTFSNFLSFWKENNKIKDGSNLDKDLLFYGNKIYSKDRCVFIPQGLNKFTTDRIFNRGDYAQGVCWHKGVRSLAASININGKKTHLGYFKSERAAHKAWHSKKMELAYEWKDICDSIHPRLFAGLMTKVRMMREK